MKKTNIFPKSWLVLYLVLFMTACNVARDNIDEHTDNFLLNDDPKIQQITVEEFQNMPIAERWKVISPGRRDKLRRLYKEGAPLSDAFKRLIAKDLAFEISEKPPNPTPRYIPPEVINQYRDEYQKALEARKLSPEKRWASFSDIKKEYIRQHPDKYPQFAKLITSGQ